MFRWIRGVLCAAAMAGMGSVQAQAQAWPGKAVRVIVPWGPGGGTDIVARALTQRLSESLHQQFIVDNRGGAGGMIGVDLGAKSPGDGYTLIVHTLSSHVLNTSYYPKLPYDPERDLTPITLVGWVPLILYVHPSLPVKTVQDVVRLARAQPGQVQYGSFATGSPSHFAAEIMAQMTGVKMVHIPYKGGGVAMAALLGGEVPLHFGGVSVGLPHVQAGKIRALAVTSTKRIAVLPKLPTMSEALQLKDYDVSVTFGMLAPASLPRDLRGQIYNAVRKVVLSDAYRKHLAKLGTEESDPIAPDALAAWLRKETARWAAIVNSTGVRAR
jgi:tripartite-type tricarboxylate transporter receptor subunit TctC